MIIQITLGRIHLKLLSNDRCGEILGRGLTIRARYAGADASAYLAKKIRQGGQGVWGSVPMPAMNQLDDTVVEALALWLASGK